MGGVACFIAATLVGLALIPLSEKVYPKNSIQFLLNTHFFGFNVNLFSLRREISAHGAVACEALSFPKMIISSAIFLTPGISLTMCLMILSKISAAKLVP